MCNKARKERQLGTSVWLFGSGRPLDRLEKSPSRPNSRLNITKPKWALDEPHRAAHVTSHFRPVKSRLFKKWEKKGEKSEATHSHLLQVTTLAIVLLPFLGSYTLPARQLILLGKKKKISELASSLDFLVNPK